MADQPSYEYFEPCAMFDDNSAARHLVPGTVPRGYLRVDEALYLGRVPRPASGPVAPPPEVTPGEPEDLATLLAAEASRYEGVVSEFPLPLSKEFIEHGRNRYMIYCVVCHDERGTGYGKIVERGYTAPPSYHIERLREAPVGHIFRVISEGYGSMPSYGAEVPVVDRWAIVAYVRALQWSRHFPEDELPEDLRQKLAATKPAAEGG